MLKKSERTTIWKNSKLHTKTFNLWQNFSPIARESAGYEACVTVQKSLRAFSANVSFTLMNHQTYDMTKPVLRKGTN